MRHKYDNLGRLIDIFLGINYAFLVLGFIFFHTFVIWLSKPVYVIGAERCTWKFADFQKSLQERGVARPLTGKEDVSQLYLILSIRAYQ